MRISAFTSSSEAETSPSESESEGKEGGEPSNGKRGGYSTGRFPRVDLRTERGKAGESIDGPSRTAGSAIPSASTSRTTTDNDKRLPPWIEAARRREPRRRTPSEQQDDEDASSASSEGPPSGQRRRRRRSRYSVQDSNDDAASSSDSEVEKKAHSRPPPISWRSPPRSYADSPNTQDGSPKNGRRRRMRKDGVVRDVVLAVDEEDWERQWAGGGIRNGSGAWGPLLGRLSSLSIARDATLSPEPRASQNHAKDDDDDLEIKNLLSRLKIEKETAERKSLDESRSREKQLWTSIEGAIKTAEEEARKRAKEEQDRLDEIKRKQAEEERKKREAQEAEEKLKREQKAQEEKDAQDKVEKDRLAAKKEKAAADEKAKEAAAAEKQSKANEFLDLRGQARKEWEMWADKMKHIKTSVLPVIASDSALRKQCFAAKRQITPKIGQLTNSKEEIARITASLSSLLTEAKNASSDKGDAIYVWVLNHLSKCLIRQAEQEVAVRLDTAYPLARLVMWLLLDGHTKLGEVLMARLVKKSCWCIGHVPERKPDQDDVAYAKSVGRSSPTETTVQFTSRQSGIVAFYFAICQTLPTSPPPPLPTSSTAPDLSRVPRHFRPEALWKWQATYLQPPMLSQSLSPALWCVLLDVAGSRLLEVYGTKQVGKVWSLLLDEGIGSGSGSGSGSGKADWVQLEEAKSSVGRLKLLLEDWRKDGTVKAAKGREMGV